MFYVYILYSETIDHYYVGQTSNLAARVESHNSELVRWTRHGIPWRLEYFEEFETRAKAMRRVNGILNQNTVANISKI